jgi:hypothetical protein
MRLKPRTLAKFAQDRGLCSVRGRVILFSESDLVADWEAIRCESSSKWHVESKVSLVDKATKRLMARARKKAVAERAKVR